MKRLIFLLLAAVMTVPAVSQDTYSPHSLIGGVGYSDTSHGFARVEYVRQTSLTNGSFPVFQYYRAQAYRLPTRDELKSLTFQATDFSTGFLFPFLDKSYKDLRVVLSIDGGIGVSTTSTGNVGYTAGADVSADLYFAKLPRWGIRVAANPNRSSVAGVHASHAFAGIIFNP